jgi:hypothetical protein
MTLLWPIAARSARFSSFGGRGTGGLQSTPTGAIDAVDLSMMQ